MPFSSPKQEAFIRARAKEGKAWAIKYVKDAEAEGGAAAKPEAAAPAEEPPKAEPTKAEAPPKVAVNAEGTKVVKKAPKRVVKKH